LLFTGLWLFNPAAWYNSAVFGQFDAIAAALLLASIILLERGKDRLAFLIAALAVMTKQHTFIPVAFMIAICARQMSQRRLLGNLAIMAGIALIISVPFLSTGNFLSYFRTILLPGQAPDYQFPLMFAFNGSAALLTYLHNTYGWNTVGLMQFCTPILIVALIAGAVCCYLKRISVARAALIGILLFIMIFYRINYQYLVIFIPLALLIASRTPYKTEKVVTLALALFPAAWVWLINVTAWFVYLFPVNPWVTPYFDKLGLTHQDIPDYAYVIFASVLTLLCLVYIVGSFIRWKKPLNPLK
jgi:uncharacterized membrane protein